MNYPYRPTAAAEVPSATQQDDPSDKRKRKATWATWIGIGITILAVGLLYRTLSQYSLAEILASIRSVPPYRLALAGLFAAASYLCLTGFDYLALRYVERPLPYRQAAIASFTSLALGHSIGFAGLSSGAIRYRFYSRWGLGAGDVAKLMLFCGMTVALGLTILGGVALILDTELAVKMTGLSTNVVMAFGLGMLAVAGLYVLLSAKLRKPLTIRGWTLHMPPMRLALGQIIIGPLNFALVAACLHQVLAAAADVGYFQTASAYVLANSATMISHVPGGLGVIESVVLYVVPGKNLIGPLLLFRCVYFLGPLMLGLASFGISELVLRRKQ
ncbi:lysylphosphatidylglycerol synthase domain-containing protein [Rhodoligotrophos defluvii]|uniref:lysylphosphatidylglycerol synthase domain-containing protein n=1 Tax=Rhodoligotrophos defluvii TaxID=2561934 RepID=UPI0010C97AC4|nr:lysylphosphatidylglycerol synthase domain-containing protein [Rhodoligotrophos defluvii]